MRRCARRRRDERPSMIIARTHIGFGSPNKQDSSKAHGSPLGTEEVVLTKRAYGWPEDKQFYVPEEALAHCREALDRGSAAAGANGSRGSMRTRRRTRRKRSSSREAMAGRLPAGWDAALAVVHARRQAVASRVASGATLNAIADALPLLARRFSRPQRVEQHGAQGQGRHVRTMSRPGATSTSACASTRWAPRSTAWPRTAASSRSPVRSSCSPTTTARRSASLRSASFRSIFVFTHDSVGLGEDGPTHQPIEHLAALRAMPRVNVIRPADANESAMAWKAAIEYHGPTVLAFSRQALPNLAGTAERRRARSASRRVRRQRSRRRPAGRDHHRHRLRGRPRRRGAVAAARARRATRAWSACRAGSSSKPRSRRTATKCCRPPSGRGCRLRQASRSAGIAGSATTATRSALMGASARLRRPRPYSRSLASLPRM